MSVKEKHPTPGLSKKNSSSVLTSVTCCVTEMQTDKIVPDYFSILT